MWWALAFRSREAGPIVVARDPEGSKGLWGKAFIFYPRTSLPALIFTTIERQVQRPLLAVVGGDKNLNSRIALLLSM